MQSWHLIVLGGLGGIALIGLIFAYGLHIPPAVGIFTVIGVLVAGVIAVVMFLAKGRKEKDWMEEAINYTQKWWRKLHGEELMREQHHWTSTYFGPKSNLFYAGVMYRSSGTNAGQPMKILLEKTTRGLQVRETIEKPTKEHLDDPLTGFKRMYEGAPTKHAEMEPWIARQGGKGKGGIHIEVGKEKEKPKSDFEIEKKE